MSTGGVLPRGSVAASTSLHFAPASTTTRSPSTAPMCRSVDMSATMPSSDLRAAEDRVALALRRRTCGPAGRPSGSSWPRRRRTPAAGRPPASCARCARSRPRPRCAPPRRSGAHRPAAVAGAGLFLASVVFLSSALSATQPSWCGAGAGASIPDSWGMCSPEGDLGSPLGWTPGPPQGRWRHSGRALPSPAK